MDIVYDDWAINIIKEVYGNSKLNNCNFLSKKGVKLWL